MYEAVVRIRGQLGELVSALDPDGVSGRAARELWTEFDRIERLGSAGKTLLARRIAASHQRDREGTRSAAESLARKAGSSTAAAKDAMDTSHRLVELPGVEGALRRGELSQAQAAAISSAADADPSAEQRLLELASRVSLAELREECARVKASADPDPEATNRRIHAQRRLRHYRDGEGGWNLSARGTAQAGAAFLTVLNAITDAIFTAARRDGRKEPVEAYAFDALMAMAEHAAGGDQPAPAATKSDHHDHHASDTSSEPVRARRAPVDASGSANPPDDAIAPRGADEATPPGGIHGGPGVVDGGRKLDGGELQDAAVGMGRLVPGDPGIFRATGRPVCPVPPSRWSNLRYLAILRVDAAALRRGHIAGEELCEIAGVGPVPISVARNLLGEAILKLVITDGVDVANVTHLGRGPTTAQKIALLWTNPRCSVQGCDRRRIEYDHQKPWADTKHTRLDELDPLCGFHHDLKTRLHWALVPGTGKRAFVSPDDPRHPSRQPARAGPTASNTRPPAASTSAPARKRRPTGRSMAYRQSPLPMSVPDDP